MNGKRKPTLGDDGGRPNRQRRLFHAVRMHRTVPAAHLRPCATRSHRVSAPPTASYEAGPELVQPFLAIWFRLISTSRKIAVSLAAEA